MKTITRNITYYVAEDGKEFTSESQCEEHEKFLKLPEYYIVIDKTRIADVSLFSSREEAERFCKFRQLESLPKNFYIYPVRLDYLPNTPRFSRSS